MDGSDSVVVVVVVGLDLFIVTYSGVDTRLNDLWVVAITSFSVTDSSSGVSSIISSSESGLLVVDLLKTKTYLPIN